MNQNSYVFLGLCVTKIPQLACLTDRHKPDFTEVRVGHLGPPYILRLKFITYLQLSRQANFYVGHNGT
jgi:hypothetical protein